MVIKKKRGERSSSLQTRPMASSDYEKAHTNTTQEHKGGGDGVRGTYRRDVDVEAKEGYFAEPPEIVPVVSGAGHNARLGEVDRRRRQHTHVVEGLGEHERRIEEQHVPDEHHPGRDVIREQQVDQLAVGCKKGGGGRERWMGGAGQLLTDHQGVATHHSTHTCAGWLRTRA